MMPRLSISFCLVVSLFCSLANGEDFFLHRFQRIPLTDVYYSEGAGFGDLNQDGVADAVYGPYWFQGPDYKQRHEIYPPQAQPRQGYADNFFSWVTDFNGDGWSDILVVGFPGKPAFVYQNPAAQGVDRHWSKHQVLDAVSNESPQFVNLVGDERPELVCTRAGFFGYATVNWADPFTEWEFHPISAKVAPIPFGHGLGVGDVDGDGRMDVLMKDGWFQQPESLEGDPAWVFHAYPFAPQGGADMHAYDVDGDGDQDVITSLQAHAYGLAWYEQLRDGDQITFRKHLIMGDKAEDNKYGVLFTELHAVQLVDMDGDGLKDIVTGKTYWSHHTQSPLWDAGAVVYWFRLTRGADGVDWVPYRADDEAGIGRGLSVGDVNRDGLPDIVVGGMKGSHVLLHQRVKVEREQFEAEQPQPRKELKAGLSPEEAARQMTVPPGFRVQLAAGEPQVHQPVAMALDARGRLWVAEAYTYPQRAPEGQGKDKIIILEDTDGDGTLDARKVFIEGLNLVSGLEVGFGGVWVGAAPYFMFIADRDADDRPDGEPEILLDGFGYQDTHETLNAFNWGPDGWLYGCHGVFTHSRVGQPGIANAQRVPMNAAVWRYHPLRHQFEVFCHGTSNPWGVDFDQHGQAFATACVIPHLWHIIQGARYQRQGGQHFNTYVYDDIKTIADHSHYAGNIQDHAWWGHEPDVPEPTSAAGGGHAHCGAMIYLGDNWPDRYRNQIFMHNIHGNRINHDILQRKGSGYVGKHGPDLLLANDRWFRGINLRYGPDGTVLLIDWYDKNACHRANPEIWDRTNGRVYRIAYGTPPRVQVDVQQLSDDELIRLHGHANQWYVRMARKVLQERGGSAAVHEALMALLAPSNDPVLRLQALWTLHATGGFDGQLADRLLGDDNEFVRAWTIQLQLEDRQISSPLHEKLVAMSRSDASPVVRLYLAAALQRLTLDQRWDIAAGLVSHEEDASDHNLPLMIWYGVEPLVPHDPSRAMALGQSSRIELIARFIARRAATHPSTRDEVVAAVNRADGDQLRLLLLDEIINALEGQVEIPMPPAWKEAYQRLQASENVQVRERADKIAVALGDVRVMARMRQLLVDQDEDLAKRQQALDILVRGNDKQAVTAYQAVLPVAGLRGAALRALSAFDHPRTPPAILQVYAELSDDEKRDAINTLVARPEFALQLLDAIGQNKVARTDLHAYNIRQLLSFNNEAIKDRIKQVWGEIRETAQEKQQQIAQLKEQLSTAHLKDADLSNGRRLFAKTCATCHTLFGEGEKVGPDITGSNRANLDYILENIVDPSAVLGKDYQMMLLALADGRIVSGLITKETDSALTVRTINDTVVVPRSDIEEQRLSDLSLMPDRLLDTFKPEEIRDLVAYLSSPAQVALKGPRAPIDSQTGRVADGQEGESLPVLSKTRGNAAPQAMGSFAADRWSDKSQLWWTGGQPGDRLELEITAERSQEYTLELVMTRARDYGIVQLSLDGQKLGAPLDLFNAPEVITTGVISFDNLVLSSGPHRLQVEIIGANPQAVPAYMFGLDYARLVSPAEPGKQ